MSDTERNRPVFIKATNVQGLTMTTNKVIGDVDFAHLENVTDLVAHGNEHVTDDSQVPPAAKSWHEKPIGFTVVTIGCGLAVAFGAYYFGWTK